MIYFVVAQRNEDGKWNLFGPWQFVNMADDKIIELEGDLRYSQIELARVLTDEDNPDRNEWLNQDKHEPLENKYDNEKS